LGQVFTGNPSVIVYAATELLSHKANQKVHATSQKTCS